MKFIIIFIAIAIITLGLFIEKEVIALTISSIILLIYFIPRIKVKRKKRYVDYSPINDITFDIFSSVFNIMRNKDLPNNDLLVPNTIIYSSDNYIANKAKAIINFYTERKILLAFDSANKGIRLDVLRFRELGKENGTPISSNDITKHQTDLARALKLEEQDISFSLTTAGENTIGIIIPAAKETNIRLRNIFEDSKFITDIDSKQVVINDEYYLNDIPVILGASSNHYLYLSMVQYPHMLIAGATSSGKSTCINAELTSLLMLHSPESLELYLIDLKDGIELTDFSNVPHCKVFCDEEQQAVQVLTNLEVEMTRRNKLIRDAGFRSITEYNNNTNKFLPFIVVVIDEFISLRDEQAIESLVQLSAKARAAGIYLILSVQKPTANNIDSRIRSNLNIRIAFKTADQNESRVILDINDAAFLRGNGDGYVRTGSITRFQGIYAGTDEMRRVVKYWKKKLQK